MNLATKAFHIIAGQPACEMMETDPDPEISLNSQTLYTLLDKVSGSIFTLQAAEMTVQQAGEMQLNSEEGTFDALFGCHFFCYSFKTTLD